MMNNCRYERKGPKANARKYFSMGGIRWIEDEDVQKRWSDVGSRSRSGEGVFEFLGGALEGLGWSCLLSVLLNNNNNNNKMLLQQLQQTTATSNTIMIIIIMQVNRSCRIGTYLEH